MCNDRDFFWPKASIKAVARAMLGAFSRYINLQAIKMRFAHLGRGHTASGTGRQCGTGPTFGATRARWRRANARYLPAPSGPLHRESGQVAPQNASASLQLTRSHLATCPRPRCRLPGAPCNLPSVCSGPGQVALKKEGNLPSKSGQMLSKKRAIALEKRAKQIALFLSCPLFEGKLPSF